MSRRHDGEKEIAETAAKNHHLIPQTYMSAWANDSGRANMYVDMAIAIGKKMNLFKDEADLQETIDFWKLHKTFG